MPPKPRKVTEKVTRADLEELSEFRYRLRRFLRVSEEITHAEGVTPLQYMLMLHTRAFPDRDWATVGEIAERLQASSHGTVALVTRCEAAGLVVRVPSAHDRREQAVRIRPVAEHGRARTITEKHAGVAVLPIDNRRELLRTDDEHGVIRARHNELLRHLQTIDKPRTGGLKVESRRPARADFMLDQGCS